MQAVQRMAKNSKISGSYCLAEFPPLSESYAYLNLLTSLRGTIEPSLSIYCICRGEEKRTAVSVKTRSTFFAFLIHFVLFVHGNCCWRGTLTTNFGLSMGGSGVVWLLVVLTCIDLAVWFADKNVQECINLKCQKCQISGRTLQWFDLFCWMPLGVVGEPPVWAANSEPLEIAQTTIWLCMQLLCSTAVFCNKLRPRGIF